MGVTRFVVCHALNLSAEPENLRVKYLLQCGKWLEIFSISNIFASQKRL